MPITTNRQYPTPDLDGPANAPLALEELADAIDTDVQAVDEKATRASALTDAASASATPYAVVRRNGDGNASFATPKDSPHAATKYYVDQAVAALPAASADAANAKAKTDKATASATPGTIIERNASGNASVAGPTSGEHIATKGYVDAIAQIAADARGFGWVSDELSVSRDSNVAVTVTFPTGRFSITPAIVVAPYLGNPSANISAHVSAMSASSATVSLRNNGTGTSTMRAHLIALQRG